VSVFVLDNRTHNDFLFVRIHGGLCKITTLIIIIIIVAPELDRVQSTETISRLYTAHTRIRDIL